MLHNLIFDIYKSNVSQNGHPVPGTTLNSFQVFNTFSSPISPVKMTISKAQKKAKLD